MLDKMGVNISGLKRGGSVKIEEPLYLDRQKPIISDKEVQEILSEMKREVMMRHLMQPSLDYCII